MSAVMERTRGAYDAIFEEARRLEYPEVDAFEQRMGFAIDRQRLEGAARVLACPLKANPPHWQHGRVLYAAALARLEPMTGGVWPLDVGTAKGFSALIMHWAMEDAGRIGQVTSVDVIHPDVRVSRNTVAELDGLQTLRETLAPWPESEAIAFQRSTGLDVLAADRGRIAAAFIDGKHEGHVVRKEGKLLAGRQQSGDLAMFDDCQIPSVSQAVVTLEEFYRFDYLTAGPRQYAVGWRR